MRQLLAVVACAFVFGCSDDNSPTGPGEDLVGTWAGVSTTDTDDAVVAAFASLLITFRADGTLTISIKIESISISSEGTWEIVGGKLILGVTTISTVEFTVRGDRLTIIDEDGTVEIYERR